ncbi:MAG TPA: hypothetical protein VHI97_01960 [Actinomycetota bacterium]|nr:hypothetical protein [Actinomycetota bacterium]
MVRRVAVRLSIALLSLTGVWIAHALAFQLSSHGHESDLLALTGHGVSRFPAVIAGMTGIAIGLAAGRLSFDRLVLIQTSAFAVLEAVERAVGAEGIGELLGQPVFYVGLLLQLVTAAVALLLARLLVTVFHRLFEKQRDVPRVAIRWRAPRRHHATWSLARAAWNVRGPPALPPI